MNLPASVLQIHHYQAMKVLELRPYAVSYTVPGYKFNTCVSTMYLL